MSDQQFGVNIHAGRATHRLTLDSEEDQKIEQEQQRLLEEKKLKKQQRQKRKKREYQEEDQPVEDAQKQIQLQKNDLNVNLFEQDSNSKADFERAKRKIKKFYPAFKQPKQKIVHKKQKKRQPSPEQSELQESQSAPRKKSEKTKKIEKVQKKPQKKSSDKKKQPQRIVQPKPKVKRQQESKQSSKKDLLIKQVAIRWWYAMPQFPPKDFDYQKELSKLGYRSVDKSVYRQVEEYVNGLQKVEPIDGFLGVYRNKYKLIDVRPKQNAPSLEYFNSLSVDQLTNLLKSALKQQINQLRSVKYEQSGQRQLLIDLQRKVNKLQI